MCEKEKKCFILVGRGRSLLLESKRKYQRGKLVIIILNNDKERKRKKRKED